MDRNRPNRAVIDYGIDIGIGWAAGIKMPQITTTNSSVIQQSVDLYALFMIMGSLTHIMLLCCYAMIVTGVVCDV